MNKANLKISHTTWVHLQNLFKEQDYRDGKHTSRDQELGSGARENVGAVWGENSVVLEQFCILFVVVVTQIYTFDKMA